MGQDIAGRRLSKRYRKSNFSTRAATGHNRTRHIRFAGGGRDQASTNRIGRCRWHEQAQEAPHERGGAPQNRRGYPEILGREKSHRSRSRKESPSDNENCFTEKTR